MSRGVRRALAELACRALIAALPRSARSWGCAVRRETDGIADDSEALRFALGSLCGLLPHAIVTRLARCIGWLTGTRALRAARTRLVAVRAAALRRPRAVGVACAVGAVMLGSAYLTMAGAPTRYLAINVAALALGVTVLTLIARTRYADPDASGRAIAAMGCALLATGVFGDAADGAARWITLAGLAVQPSLVLVPVMLVLYARTCHRLATLGIVAAAAALAIQPDRAMASVLVAGVAALCAYRRDRHMVVALSASVLGLAVTLLRPDTLPAAPFVDRIYYSAFDVHLAAGAAVLLGALLLLVPALLVHALQGGAREPLHRAGYAVFGAVWCAAMLAAALGNYPTPVVGYGGSAIIGYALSLLAFPSRAAGRRRAVEPAADAPEHTGSDWRVLVGPC